jgi:signal transduction histidine kinase
VEKHARKELQRLDKAKSQFMMATQHHLRTPLTSMRGYLDLLFGGSYGKIPPKIKDILKKFESSTKNEIKIVNEFLDISKFQMGKKVVVLKEGVDLEPILKEAVEDVELEARSKGIYLKKDISGKIPKIKADEQRLKVAIYNIVDNAVKYTDQGGIEVKLVKIDGKVRIIVKDTGTGIPEEQKSKLFSKLFERGERAQKLFATGKGIGLYITAKIIQEHNGKVWAESGGKGKGSTFYIELPVR